MKKQTSTRLEKKPPENKPNNPSYFAKQEKVYPKRVWGRFRKLKWIAMVITLAIYYLTPFIRWDRGPYMPDQAVLIDLPNRKAYWFWIEIWPQEVYILAGLLILAAVALFFVTALFGRVWCGYFCPQTVWTDLFVWVERIVQGDRNARKKLHNSPWNWDKIKKISLTHFLWLVIAWSTAGSFVLYFNDAPELVLSFFRFDVSPTVLTFIVGLTLSTYLMAGFAREQVCTYMCPYARFQSAMFDEDTLIIGYDDDRGEPRGKHKKGESWEGRGHCIDCTACVQVCPVGIDIREGLQMECIACGLCVDACNNIMDLVNLPPNLIRYDTLNHLEAKKKGGDEKFNILRLRSLYYALILLAVGFVMLYALWTRPLVELHAMHDRNPVFVKLSDGEIRNKYTIKILNKTHDHHDFIISLKDFEDANLDVIGSKGVDREHLHVKAGEVGTFKVAVKAPPQDQNSIDATLEILSHGGGLKAEQDIQFISRLGGQ